LLVIALGGSQLAREWPIGIFSLVATALVAIGFYFAKQKWAERPFPWPENVDWIVQCMTLKDRDRSSDGRNEFNNLLLNA
jgi:hypothetical protein